MQLINIFKKPVTIIVLMCFFAAIGLYSEYVSNKHTFVTLGDFSNTETVDTNTDVDTSTALPEDSVVTSPSVGTTQTTITTDDPTPLVAGEPAASSSGFVPAPPTATTSTSVPPVSPTQPEATTNKWKPSLTSTFYIQLQGTLPTYVPADIYVIDLFDTSIVKISELKQKGSHVICYFSAGSAEDWRDDYSKFTATDKGAPLSGWEGESWVDTRSSNVRDIMSARIKLAASKGCDGVDPDNVDGYTNEPGVPLTAETQLDYNRFLAAQAHANGLLISLKNAVGQLSQLSSSFDLAINEQCNVYNECSGYQAFTSAGKPVLNIEYANKYVNNTNGAFDVLCAKSKDLNIYTLILPRLLNGSFRKACN